MVSHTILNLLRVLIKSLKMSEIVLKKPHNHTQTQVSKKACELFEGYAIKIEGFLNWTARAPW